MTAWKKRKRNSGEKLVVGRRHIKRIRTSARAKRFRRVQMLLGERQKGSARIPG